MTLALPYTPFIVIGDKGRVRVDTVVLPSDKRLMPEHLPPAPLPLQFDGESEEYLWERSVNWLVDEVFTKQVLRFIPTIHHAPIAPITTATPCSPLSHIGEK